MQNEFEIVSNQKFKYINVLLVRIISRTPHLHNEYELGTVLDGNIELTVQDKKTALCKNDFYFLNALTAHEFLSNGNGALLLILQFSPKFLNTFFTETPRIRFSTEGELGASFKNKEHFEEFKKAFYSLSINYFKDDYASRFKISALMCELFSSLIENLEYTALEKDDYQTLKEKVGRIISIINYIDQNYTEKLLLSDIAKRENLSLTYLSHLFTDTVGVSFQDYIQKKRLEYAFYLICNTDENILNISLQSGFSNVRYLNKQFYERFKCTPKDYRHLRGDNNKLHKTNSGTTQFFPTVEETKKILNSLFG